MKIFVLGHRGMLGHMVVRYLRENGRDVIVSQSRYSGQPRDPLVEEVRESGCEWIINAVGRIKQKCADTAELYLVNSQLPVHLKARLRPGQQLVHASTDCVFSGKRGNYTITDERDADDVYGFSKILGENAAEVGRCLVLRTSIIGPGLGDNSGLMGWYLSQTKPVKGFVNHRWNGITTLEWAKACLEVIDGRLQLTGAITQLGVLPVLSKYELLQLIGSTWDHPLDVMPTEAPETIDRTLRPQFVRSSLETQLKEFRDWYPRPTHLVSSKGTETDGR